MQEDVFGYARYSSPNQREASAEAQSLAIEAYCQSKGYRVKNFYVDRAKTGANANRPEFQKMLQAIQLAKDKGQPVESVIVYKLDRFSRNPWEAYFYKNLLHEQGVKLESILEDLDDNTPESALTASVMIGVSDYYIQNLSREVKKGLLLNAGKGIYNGGKIALGYNLSADKKIVVNLQEAESVKMIFQLYDMGFGYASIVQKLNQAGYLTKTGKPFSKNSLPSIVTNEKYIGRYVYNKAAQKMNNKRNSHKFKPDEEVIRIDNAHPAIIDQELFYRVQARISGRQKSGYSTKENYWLKGFIKCRECNKNMTGSIRYSGCNNSKYSYYTCPHHQIDCQIKAVNRYHMEHLIQCFIKKILFAASYLDSVMEDINIQATTLSATAKNDLTLNLSRAEKIKKERQNLIDLAAKTIDDSSLNMIGDKLKQLATEESDIHVRMDQLTCNREVQYRADDVKDALNYFDEFVSADPLRVELRKFLNRGIDKILVDNESVEIKMKYAKSKRDKLVISINDVA